MSESPPPPPFPENPEVAQPNPLTLSSFQQWWALDCARCILAQGESDLLVTAANVRACTGLDNQTVLKGLKSAAEAGLMAEQQAHVVIPGQSTSANEYVLTESGQAELPPRLQSDCRLRETGPVTNFTTQQQRALRCASCLIAHARERNAMLDDPGAQEQEAARAQEIVTCAGIGKTAIYKTIGVLVDAGYFRKAQVADAGALRKDHGVYEMTELGERRLGVDVNPDCPGADVRTRELLSHLPPALWLTLRCFDCIYDTLSQPGGEQYGLPGITARMISSCSELAQEHVGGRLAALARANYARRVVPAASSGLDRRVRFYVPNPRLLPILDTAGKSLLPGNNCYSVRLVQGIEGA